MNSGFTKKHGMKDPRWTIRDKIFQYKGLVKLLDRDSKIHNSDKIVTEKRLSKNLIQLKNDMQENSKTLSNAIKCDPITQNIILNKNNNLQKLYKDFHPAKTIEHLEHKIFNKTKLLDRLNVRYKRKLKELCNQKSELAKIEKNSAYFALSNAKHESKLEAILGKIEEFQIKRDTAIQIKKTYEGILKVLEKDSVYFNKVLEQLNADIKNQGKCIYTATVIGQIATEHADDTKQQFVALNKCIENDYKHRISTIEISKKHVKHLQCNFKNVIRTSDTISQTSEEIPFIKEFDDRTSIEEVKKLEQLLESLQQITRSNSFKDILPCMKKQLLESRNLAKICNNNNAQRNDLLHKLNNAQVSYSKLQNVTNTETFEYMHTKKELKKILQNTKKKIDVMTNVWNEDIHKINQTQAAVMHLSQLCKNINLPVKSKIIDENENIIEDLCLKLSVLMSTVKELDIETNTTPFVVQKCYEKLLGSTSTRVACEEKSNIVHFSDIEEFTLADPNVHTYKSIKEKSKRTMEENKKPSWQV